MNAKAQQLQEAYKQVLRPYFHHLQFAVTLTLKQAAKISTPYTSHAGVYTRWVRLDEDTTRSTLRRFTALLRRRCFGHAARHASKQSWAAPLAIYTVEGRNTHKRTHIHAALGNIPERHVTSIPSIVETAWLSCDFGYREFDIQPISGAEGWIGYITKELGYTDNDCVDVVSMTIPPFIQRRA